MSTDDNASYVGFKDWQTGLESWPSCLLRARVRLFATPWTAACQALLSMGFSRQEYWKVLPCPPPGHLNNPGMKPMSLAYPVLGVRFFTTMYHPISVSRLGLGQSLVMVMEMKGHPQNSNTEWKRTAFKMGITPLHQHLYKYLANLHSTLTVLTRCFLFFCFFKQTLSAFF